MSGEVNGQASSGRGRRRGATAGRGAGVVATAMILCVTLTSACSPSRPPGGAGVSTRPSGTKATCDAEDSGEVVAGAYANNRRTGEYRAPGAPGLARERWRTADDLNGPLLAVDGILIAHQHQEVVVLDSTTGNERWRRAGRAEAATSERTLIVDSGLSMVDTATGREHWHVSDPQMSSEVVEFHGATFSGRYVVVVLEEESLVLDAATGQVLRRGEVAGEPDLPAVADDFMTVTGEVDQTISVKLDDARTTWAVEGLGAEFVPPVVACHSIYLGSTARTMALDQGNGDRRWEVPTDQSGDIPPAVAGGLAVIPSRDGMQTVDATTGVARWQVHALADVATQPAIASGTVYVTTTDTAASRSTLYSFVAATGQAVTTVPLPPVEGAPVVVADMVVVDLADGPLIAFASE